MTRDDEECLKLGREVVRMIHEVHAVMAAEGPTGYSRRTFSFPGGEVELLIATRDVADLFDGAASAAFEVVNTQARRIQ